MTPIHMDGTTEETPNNIEGIVDAYRLGEAVSAIAEKTGMTRLDLGRVLRQFLAERVISKKIKHFFHPTFNLPKAEAMYRGPEPESLYRQSPVKKAPSGMTSLYIADLYTRPLLSLEGEQFLFKKYNYLKYRAVQLRDMLYERRPKLSTLREIDAFLSQADEVRNRIIEANLRLVIPVAQKFWPQMPYLDFQEVIDAGNNGLFAAVENFDISRGNRFSTYGTVSVFRKLQRFRFEEMRRNSREQKNPDLPVSVLEDIQDSSISSDEKLRQADITSEVNKLMRHANAREADILKLRFGIGGPSHTFQEVADLFGLTRERIRQIELRALQRLSTVAQRNRQSLLELLSD